MEIAFPHLQIRMFKERLGITDEELRALGPFREVFAGKSGEFAEHFYNVFYSLPETRMILEHERRLSFLKSAWARWFEALFRKDLDGSFLEYLWRVGIRHVEVNLDQRYSNLGFSIIRQFCHEIIMAEIPVDRRTEVSRVVDRLVDLCVMVETTAYIEATTRCDLAIINAIADKIRNPVTIIGGNVRRLKEKTDPSAPVYEVYDFIINQSIKCEHLVEDIKVYNEVFQSEPEFKDVAMEGIIRKELDRLQAVKKFEGVKIDVAIEPEASVLKGDPLYLGHVFYYLLQNSLEAVDPKNPYIKVSSTLKGAPPHSVMIEIFNTGAAPRAEDLDKIFAAFYSTKAAGSGFGLTIARLAVKKHFGSLRLEPLPGEGTRVVMALPISE
jgi:signal transduction histidine kinase